MTHNFHPSYRPDIDGLRAIAILSVVIFHAFPDVISGGFIGVDIFFVISGFLISNIIFKSLETGGFGYIDFYIRRIKRIFPALIFVLIFTIIAGWFVLLPDEFSLLGKHVVAGAIFVSNILSWKEVGYFNAASELKPLLHLWSLGVEEQYYIVWPILVGFIWKRSHSFLLIVLPILLLSFLINVYAVNVRPEATFYLPITRFWELMVGSLLAYVTLHKIRIFHTSITDNSVSWIGFLLLLIGVFWVDSEKSFPGWWALVPTMGAFLLIYAGKNSWVNSRILANKVIVYIGLISYPFYLWHWPLLAYSKVLGLNETCDKLVVVFISVVLAYITYVLIEKPIRFGSRNVSVWLITAMLAVTVVGLGAFTGILHSYHDSKSIQKISHAAGEWEYPGGMSSFRYNTRTFFQVNSTIKQQTVGEIVYFGDSNMEQYYPNIDELNIQKQKNIIFTTEGGCPPIPEVFEYKHPQCDGFVNDVIAYASNPEVNKVVIGASWYSYFGKDSKYYLQNNHDENKLYLSDPETKKLALRYLESMLIKLNSMGKTTFLILNIPMGEALDPKNIINRSMHSDSSFYSYNYDGVKKSDLDKYRDIDTSLIEIAHRTNAVVIDPKISLCSNGRCPSITDDGEPIYKDSSHLRPSFVRTQIHFLDSTLN